MARTGTAEAKSENADTTAQSKQAFATSQTAVNKYNQNEATLNSGGQVAANPWSNQGYLANVNRVQSAALEGANEGGKVAIENNNRRTGGLNSTAAFGAIKSQALQKMRLADQLTAERRQQDYMNNIAYQQNQAQAPLNVASAENPYYGTATTGRSSAVGNLTQIGLASYGPWNAAIGAAGAAAGAALGKPPA